MKLKDKVAIVAGGGQGIGEGIIKCLAMEGADIAVVDINSDTAKKVAAQVKEMGRKALPITADLTQEKQVNKAVKDTVDFFGKVDILINNVGGASLDTWQLIKERAAALGEIANLVSFMPFSPEVWDRYYELNLKSHVMLSHAVTPYFVKQRSGKIINISSISGRIADPGQMPYGAMKAADISITWSMAKALGPYNVTVNCICPGFVFTHPWERSATNSLNALRAAKQNGKKLPALLSQLTDAEIESMTPKEYYLNYIVASLTPNKRDQTAEDMGNAIAFLVSEDAKNITGQVFHVDGGFIVR